MMDFGSTPIIGTIEKGEITFDSPSKGTILYYKVFSMSDVDIVQLFTLFFPLFIIWLIIFIIQNFLAYGLAHRQVLREGKSGNGVSLFSIQLHYYFLSLIPGPVIYLWLKERKED